MINKNHLATKEALVAACFQAFVDERQSKYDRIQKEEEMKELEARMAQFSKEQASKSKKVLSRMNAGTDQGLLTMCLTAMLPLPDGTSAPSSISVSDPGPPPPPRTKSA